MSPQIRVESGLGQGYDERVDRDPGSGVSNLLDDSIRRAVRLVEKHQNRHDIGRNRQCVPAPEAYVRHA